MKRSSAFLLLAALGLSALAAAGCGSDSSSGAAAGTTAGTTAAATGATALAGVCPAKIVVQTDWNPESDHSEVYQLAASDGTIDAGKKRYTADLIDTDGNPSGVQIEIRAGGPAVGFQSPTQQMFSDDSIYMGYVNTDESIRNSVKTPTVSVIAPRAKWAQVLIYDPATYDFTTIADIGKTDATVLYFQGNYYMDYLVGAGILKKSQVDASYDGKPARFVTSGGKVVQQGFITAEPWQYENQVKPWMKPVATLSIADSGYPNYGETLAVRKADLAADAPCLKKLVPMLQQAQVDYAADPSRANAIITKIVPEYNTGWIYPAELADYAAKAQLDNGIIANGTDGVMGSMDAATVQKMIDIVGPIYAKANIKVKEGLTPEDLFTDEFLDTSITLP